MNMYQAQHRTIEPCHIFVSFFHPFALLQDNNERFFSLPPPFSPSLSFFPSPYQVTPNGAPLIFSFSVAELHATLAMREGEGSAVFMCAVDRRSLCVRMTRNLNTVLVCFVFSL